MIHRARGDASVGDWDWIGSGPYPLHPPPILLERSLSTSTHQHRSHDLAALVESFDISMLIPYFERKGCPGLVFSILP